MRRLLAALVVAGLTAGGAVAAAPVQAAPARGESGFTPAPISWGQCESPGLQSRNAQCGLLTVPLDYSRPGGTKIKLAVSRIVHKSSAADYQGVMLTNPGGPGGSGLTLSVLGEYVPDDVGSDYDWIGWDPRGVGSSEPSLTCDGELTTAYNRPYYVPVTRSLEKTWLNRSKTYAQECAKAGGALLDHVKTTDTVADMESIRKALGAKQINFYGFSYGTYLGQVYSTLHPDRVRRMVLDGNVDPRGVWYDANLAQDTAFDANSKVYWNWIARYDSVYHLGTTGKAVEKKYYATLEKLRKAPAGGVIGPDEWADVFTSAAYYVFEWTDIADAFAALVNNSDYAPVKALYDGGYPQGPGTDNGYAMYLATQCTDVKWPQSWDKWRRDNWRTYAKAPFLTWGNAWFNAPCLYWKGDVGKPVRISGKKTPPILLISETKDAATPYSGSLQVRKLYPRSVLVEGVGGTTHAGSLNGIACVDDTIAAYLADGSLPNRVRGNRSDKQCDPLPQPDPTAAAAKSATATGGGAARLLQGTSVQR
ncbi:alpha/beta hydrolase [Actinoplanes friuliensis]|uniref:Putative tripeptidylaminopeptidase n=1 Tax=Actinoplanes friuliensis DSM 7358 TaxID=1246995 RepID=U5VXS4_9ACTN|nr:alpha/beta hydrolase [Actinoplanes friuliensis]AGZ41788.1 putative tripeptidylaminopeptidase [Actinoplanes friuliensis DSM 7358]